MPESRDRLERNVDHAQVFLRRRAEGILEDQQSTEMTPTATAINRPTTAGGRIGIRIGTETGTRRNRNQNRENTPSGSGRGSSRRSRIRGRNSILPIWYPRTPLRDVTAVVRAIERSRARLRDIEGRGNDSPAPQLDRASLESGGDGVHIHEQNISFVSPVTTVGKVPKILLGITKQNDGGSETPQKRLLNSIDKVEKEVMEELQKLKKTPSAKRAEREKRVHTLMSMR